MLRKLHFFTFIALLVFVGFIFASNGIAQNLIANGEFDDGETGWGGWINGDSVDITVSIDTNSVLSGKNSYKLDIVYASKTSYYIQRNTACPLKFGKKYNLSFMAKADRDSATINVLFELQGDPYTKYLNVNPVVMMEPQTFNYTLEFSEFTVPTNELKLHFGGAANDSTIMWIDAVVVTEEAGQAVIPEGNLILNPEFDDGEANWGGWINGDSVDITVSVDTNGVLSGKNSYKLDIVYASKTSYYIQRNTACPLKFGKKYNLSFMAKADRDSATINVLFELQGDPYTKYLNVNPVVMMEPQIFNYTLEFSEFTVPTNELKLHFGGAANDSTIMWIDAVFVTEEAGQEVIPEGNLTLNPEFDDGDANWDGWINTGSPNCDVTVSVDTNGVLSGKNSYRLDINLADTISYYIQRNTPAPIDSGYSYKVSFLGVADRDSIQVHVLFEQRGDPYTKYLSEVAILNTVPKKFEYTLVGNMINEPTNEIKLHFGGTDSTNNDNSIVWIDAVFLTREVYVTIDDKRKISLPKNYTLYQNYPNPFNPITTIEFYLPVHNKIRLVIVNILGEVVKEIANGSYPAGQHKVQLDGSNMATGVYFYKLEAGNFVDVKKFILLK